MSPYRRAPERTLPARPDGRARIALFLAIAPLLLLGAEPLLPLWYYYNGGCVSEYVGPVLLFRQIGDLPLVAAALPVNVSALALAGLIAAAAVRRFTARYRRPRGPIPGRASRRAAMWVVGLSLATVPVFVVLFLVAAVPDDMLVPFGECAALSLATTAAAAALFLAAFDARGYRRWGMLLAAWTTLATPRFACTVTWTLVLDARMESVVPLRHQQGWNVEWERFWGADATIAAFALLVLLSLIAAAPKQRLSRTETSATPRPRTPQSSSSSPPPAATCSSTA